MLDRVEGNESEILNMLEPKSSYKNNSMQSPPDIEVKPMIKHTPPKNYKKNTSDSEDNKPFHKGTEKTSEIDYISESRASLSVSLLSTF